MEVARKISKTQINCCGAQFFKVNQKNNVRMSTGKSTISETLLALNKLLITFKTAIIKAFSYSDDIIILTQVRCMEVLMN